MDADPANSTEVSVFDLRFNGFVLLALLVMLILVVGLSSNCKKLQKNLMQVQEE